MSHLKDKGFSVGNIHRDEIRKGILSRKILSAKSMYLPRTKSLRRAMADYTKGIPHYHGGIWERDLLNAAYKLEQRYAQKMDYALFDEGPTQYVSAMMHDIEIDDRIQPLLDEMNKSIYCNNVIAFFIVVDTNNLIERISQRDRKGDRFLTDDIEEMRSRIIQKENNLRYLASHLNYSSIYYIENNELADAIARVKNILG